MREDQVPEMRNARGEAITVDQTFAQGHIVGFFAIIGSTSEGWQFQVHFDSPNKNSFVSLPVIAGVIPEFTDWSHREHGSGIGGHMRDRAKKELVGQQSRPSAS